MTAFGKRFARIPLKRGALGARAFVAPFSSRGVISVAGSVAGGLRGADACGMPRDIASLHAEMLMEGTRTNKKRAIQLALDSIGAELSFGASADRLQFFARTPSECLPRLLSLIAEVLSEPSFPSHELSVLKKRSLAQLALAAEDTRTQAGILLSRALYPRGHLNYAETIEESRTALISCSTQDLRTFHRKTFNPGTLILVAAGDVAPAAFAREAQRQIARLPAGSFSLAPYVPQPRSLGKPRRAVLPIAGKASIDYFIGLRVGITDDHPDYPALLLGLRILGNSPGFTGRLMQTIRETEGLTYGTYAYLSGFDGGADGHALAWGTFAPQLFARGRAGIRRELQKLASAGASAQEVARHRELYAAQQEVHMNDSSAFASAGHEVVSEGRDLSYLDTFPERIRKLSSAEVNAALRKYLVLGHMCEAAAGPAGKNVFG